MGKKWISKKGGKGGKRRFGVWTTLKYGKYKGMKIEEVLKVDVQYVTKYLMGTKGYKIAGLDWDRYVSQRIKGYDLDAGLYMNFMFYGEYGKGKENKDGSCKIVCFETGLIIEGKSLAECITNMNKELTEAHERVEFDI